MQGVTFLTSCTCRHSHSTSVISRDINMDFLHEPLDEAVLEDIYSWIDQIPLSRPKKNFARDFSDGGMVAEVIAHYFPRLVEIHNYPSSTVTSTKIESWHTMNRKVLRKLNFQLSEEAIKDIVNCKPYVMERMLVELRQNIDSILWERQKQNTQKDVPESDQYIPSPRAKAKVQKFPPALPKPKPQQTGPSDETQTGSNVTKKVVKPVVSTAASSVVSRWQYESKEQECAEREQTIMFLQAKVDKLEQLMQLKDMRIEELTQENVQLKRENKLKVKTKGKPRGF